MITTPRQITVGDFLHLEDRIEELQLYVRNAIIASALFATCNTALMILLFLK